MSASEKLRALEVAMDADAGRPAGFEAHISYLDAFPQIVALVKAVEEAPRLDYCDADDGEGLCSSSDGEFAEWEEIGDALTALDKALVSAES